MNLKKYFLIAGMTIGAVLISFAGATVSTPSDVDDSDVVGEEGEALDSEDVDLGLTLQNIKPVWVRLKDGNRAKMYKVTMSIHNLGNEFMNDTFKYSIKGPLTNKYETGSTAEITGQTHTMVKTTQFPEKQPGKVHLQIVNISFYVNRKDKNKNYIISIDPENKVEETNETNNDLLINIIPSV